MFPRIKEGFFDETLTEELTPIFEQFALFSMGEVKKLPPSMYDFIIRDILHYTQEELDMLDYDQYILALVYSINTYMQRNVLMSLNKLFSKKESNLNTAEEVSFYVKQPEIKKWLKEHYDELERKKEVE